MSTIAFIGLGAMGAHMAQNLLSAGHTLRVWNRSPGKTEAARAAGATVCASIAEAVAGANFVVSMVADDNATREVMLGAGGVVANAAPGTVIIDSSTNTPAMAREVATAARARGVGYLDAPVSGSLAQARDRELVFMVGGSHEDLAAAQPLLAAMGRMHRHMGEVGRGATIKLINNMLSGTVNVAIAEALQVAEAAGLDPQATQQVLGEGAAGCRLMKTKMPKIYARDFSPQFQLSLMEKDLRYFLSLAQELDRPVPVAALVRSQLQSARRADLGGLDVSAVYLQLTGEARRGV